MPANSQTFHGKMTSQTHTFPNFSVKSRVNDRRGKKRGEGNIPNLNKNNNKRVKLTVPRIQVLKGNFSSGPLKFKDSTQEQCFLPSILHLKLLPAFTFTHC